VPGARVRGLLRRCLPAGPDRGRRAARFAVGLAASAAYTGLAALARHDGAVPLVNGIMVQAGCIGALVGPPLFAAVTGLRHWHLATPAASNAGRRQRQPGGTGPEGG
jgi:hypothetical protein